MDDIVMRPRYTRYGTHSRKRKKNYNRDGRPLSEILARQVLLSVVILLVIGMIKGINTPLTNMASEKIKAVLFYNIELQSLYQDIDGLLKKLVDVGIPAGTGTVSNTGDSQGTDTTPADETENFVPVDEEGAVPVNAGTPAPAVPDGGNGAASSISVNTEESAGKDAEPSGAAKPTQNTAGPAQANPPQSGAKRQDTASRSGDMTSLSGIKFKFVTPVGGLLGSPFGVRLDPISKVKKNHNGVDIEADNGTSIKAALGGTIVTAGYSSSYGNYIKIDHGDGVQTVYAHCSKLIGKKGQKVKQGDIIAKVGSTGESTGPHLHFEIWKDGKPVDPAKLVKIPV